MWKNQITNASALLWVEVGLELAEVIDYISPPARVPVPFIPRILVAAGGSLLALGGVYTAYAVQSLFADLRNDATAGTQTVLNGLGSIEQTAILFYVAAIVLFAVYIAVALMRRDDPIASIHGFWYVAAALPAFFAPLLANLGVDMVLSAFHASKIGDLAATGATVATLSIFAIIVGAASFVILTIFALLPLKTKLDSNMSSFVAVCLLAVGVLATAAYTFHLLGQSTIPASKVFTQG